MAFIPSSLNLDDIEIFKDPHSHDSLIGFDKKRQMKVDITLHSSSPFFHPMGNSNEFYCHQDICYMNGIVRILGIQSPLLKSNKKFFRSPTYDDYSSALVETEYMVNGTFLDFIKKCHKTHKIDPTIQSKIIYGVAAIMNRLYKNKIFHHDLLRNIYLDENFEPKILLTCWSFIIDGELELYHDDIAYNILFVPELESDCIPFSYTVFCFGCFLYTIFEDYDFFGVKVQINLRLPRLLKNRDQTIPPHYIELIERCCTDNPDCRPTFTEIVEILKDDKYAFPGTDLNELHAYRNRIDNDIDEVSMRLHGINANPLIGARCQSILLDKTKKVVDLGRDCEIDGQSEYYTNQGSIGQGATCITYKIVDTRTQLPICKKVIKYRGDQTTVKDIQRVRKEFEVLYKLRHPCICQAYGINMHEPISEMVSNPQATTISLYLEFLEISMKDIMKMGINNTMKTKMVVDIVHGMKYLHQKGIIHRDLKIENIMLNSVYETKLVDFGLIRITESALEEYSFVEDSLTRGVGTLAYMSPEMINEEDYDFKTDVYSFGIVLYALFVGTLPKQSIKDKINKKEIIIPPASENMSEFCRELISNCLAPSSSDRPTFEGILLRVRNNSYQLANNVNPSIISQRDNELTAIEELL